MSFPGFSIHNGGCQRAPSPTELCAILVHVHQDAICARLADHLAARVPRDPLSSLIPVGDPPCLVDEIHTVTDVVQDVLVKIPAGVHFVPFATG